MKLKKITTSISCILACTCSIGANAEYKTKSIFSADYKCLSEETGGFKHDSSGHKLTLFKNKPEFFITHISNIPSEAILKFSEMVSLNSNDIGYMREVFESRVMKQEKIGDSVIEKSSYSIRTAEENPKDLSTYTLGMIGCTAQKWDKNLEISCYENDQSQTFHLNLETMRFTYSYAGSWHSKRVDGYYGDSSEFSFGTCKKYYP